MFEILQVWQNKNLDIGSKSSHIDMYAHALVPSRQSRVRASGRHRRHLRRFLFFGS